MGTTVKGLLRGLRYITQIFDSVDEEEPEMQIGAPTDVKHVAHIGCDGPSANSPSWMNEFKASSEILNGHSNSVAEVKKPSNVCLEDASQNEKVKPKLRRPPTGASGSESPARKGCSNGPKHSRRQPSDGISPPVGSPRSSDLQKHSRRRRSASNLSMDSPSRDPIVGSRPSTEQQNSTAGAESPAREQSSVPKHSRGKKSKGSSCGGISKASKSRDHNASVDADAADHESMNPDNQITSILEA